MNLKIANLIAVEFGVFIGIMSWLAYSRIESPESPEPRAAAESQDEIVQPVATVAPAVQPRSPRRRPGDNANERERTELVDENMASTVQAREYYPEIATEPYISYGLNGSIVKVVPSYVAVAQEPAAVSPDYADYTASPQFVVYPEFASYYETPYRRSFAKRCRSNPRFGGPRRANPDFCPTSIHPPGRGGGAVPHCNPGGQTYPSFQNYGRAGVSLGGPPSPVSPCYLPHPLPRR
jgi:hypothetical protein